MTETDFILNREGLVDFYTPRNNEIPSKKMSVFYNPKMQLKRDISIALLSNILMSRGVCGKKIEILDCLSATGISGLRYAIETLEEKDIGALSVTLNDHNPKAFELILKNIALAGDPFSVSLHASKNDGNAIMGGRFFDIIDIDPFGSPVLYLDTALQSLRINGWLFLTATDVSVLCGTYPRACRRRYMANSWRVPFSHELGLRILLGYCVRAAAKFDLAIKPVLCYFADHYYRLFVSTERGSKTSDDCLRHLGLLEFDIKTGKRTICDWVGDWSINVTMPGDESRVILGPLWTGKLIDIKMAGSLLVKPHFGSAARIERLLRIIQNESSGPPYYYTLSEFGSRFRIELIPLQDIISRLVDKGHYASATHFSYEGFKTDASVSEIQETIREGKHTQKY